MLKGEIIITFLEPNKIFFSEVNLRFIEKVLGYKGWKLKGGPVHELS